MAENVALKSYGSAGHFANNLNFEVQRTNHFEVVIDLDRVQGLGADIAEHIRMSTKEMAAPKVESDALELKHGNDTVKVAKAPTYGELELTLYDTIGVDQLNVIQSWFNKVFNWDTKLMGNVIDYKASGTLYMYSPDCKVIRKWVLEGVWPKSFGSANGFSFDNADAQTVSVTLCVDRFHEEMDTNNY